MRIDSCRKCGIELEINKKCGVCKNVSQLFCHKCGNVTDEQIHLECNLKRLDYGVLKTSVVDQ